MTRPGRTATTREVQRPDDAGEISVFTVLIITALLLVTGLVLDAGLALSTKIRALDVAQSAARAAAGQVDVAAYRATGEVRLDRSRSLATARQWLAAAGMTGEVTATATTVSVTAHASRQTQLLTLIGVDRLNVSAAATAAAYRGVTAPEQ